MSPGIGLWEMQSMSADERPLVCVMGTPAGGCDIYKIILVVSSCSGLVYLIITVIFN